MGTVYRSDVSWPAYGSMVLGVMAFVVFPYSLLTIIPALCLAHLALWRARLSDEPVEGKGLAVVGLVMNYGFILAIFILPVAVTYFDEFDKRPLSTRIDWILTGFHSRPKARQADCGSNLKQIGIAILEYSGKNGGYFPDNLETLLNQDPVLEPKIFTCPDRRFYQPLQSKDVITDFVYLGKGLRDDHPEAPSAILLYDLSENHRGQSLNILFIDGHVGRYNGDSVEKAILRFNLIVPEAEN